MKIKIRPFTDADTETWENLCDCSTSGTLLHTRQFLSYHGDRFRDCSVLIFDDTRVAGLLAAAVHPRDSLTAASHPGITYGGIVHDGSLTGSAMISALEALCVYFQEQGFKRLLYKPVPHIYHKTPAQDDLYALFRIGGKRVRCDVAATIDLSHRLKPSLRRRRSLKKANKLVTPSSGLQFLEAFWAILEDNLSRKHETVPVHDLDEIRLLAERFPDNIKLRVALLEGRLIAGVLVFATRQVWHAQYIASSEEGNNCSALDAVFESLIEETARNGARYFDFGTSNEDEGRTLNDGLYRFKNEFGGGGVAYEQYQIDFVGADG